MILIVSCVFPPEQIVSANLSKDIAEKLAANGKEVSVFSPKPSRPFGKKFENRTPDDFPYEHYEASSFVFPKSNFIGRLYESISFGLASRKHIRSNRERIEKIYANTWPLFAQYFLVREAKKNNIPVIIHVQDVYPESYVKKVSKFIGSILTMLIMPLELSIMEHADKIIMISPSMKEYLSNTRNIPDRKGHIVRNWQDDAFLSQTIERKNSYNGFTFMYAGSVSSSAGVDLLIKAFKELDKNLNCRLVIAGNGSDKESCIKLAKDNKKIEFWEAPYEKIPLIQSQADVLLLPLKKGIGKTATPSKFIAYLFSKKPVLASIDEHCDTANSIKDANCGMVVPPENINELKDAMARFITTSSTDLVKMGDNGFNYAQKHLSKKENLNSLIKIIDSI